MNRDEILAAIKQATGNPDTGPVHAATPAIADAIDALANPKPETNTKPKAKQETRVMNNTTETRDETT